MQNQQETLPVLAFLFLSQRLLIILYHKSQYVALYCIALVCVDGCQEFSIEFECQKFTTGTIFCNELCDICRAGACHQGQCAI